MGALSAIFQLDGQPADPSLLNRISGAAAGNGAATVTSQEGPIALAYRDDAASAEQLVADEANRLRIVLTGQIYNRDELRSALGLGGQEPISDARLILRAYRAWGRDAVGRLDGDFAFVLFDAEQSALLCARDALGVRPLFYARQGERFMVASAPHQLLAGGTPATPSEISIAAYLSLARHLTGGPHSYFREIDQVEPGHCVRIDARGVESHCHWQLDPEHRISERTEDEMAEHVRQLMIDAVARRLPPTGPYGCALTGGFDSSSVAVLLRRALDQRGVDEPLESFSFELRDADADEPELIKAVAEVVKANHHSAYLDQDNVFEALPQLLRACDGPTRDMGLLYLWRKKEMARRHDVRLVLSGLGGDELFFGRYHYFADLLRSFRLTRIWTEFKGLYPIDRSTGKPTSWSNLLIGYTFGPLLPPALRRTWQRVKGSSDTVQPWIHPQLAQRADLADRLRQGPQRVYRDAYRQDCWEVFTMILVNVTVPLHEALGAAVGVETRFPLLDRRLVEYMFAVPREHKIREGRTRILQRRAMEGLLPDIVVREHLKKNMNPVLWRQQSEHLKKELDTLFRQKELRCADYFDIDHLRGMHQDFQSGQGSSMAGYVLWYALNMERWLEQIA